MAGDPFGASEELWTRTALLLAKEDVPLAASVQGWPRLDRRITELSAAGVDVRPRPFKHSVIARARRRMSGKGEIAFDIDRTFRKISPNLVVINNGAVEAPLELIEMCVARGWPFVTIDHAHHIGAWPTDEIAARLRMVLPAARRCYFVSAANRALAEKQLGYAFENAEVVRNPLTINIDSPIRWPSVAVEQELRMACVGRLKPGVKGQDILLDVLAGQSWRNRSWRLTIYGTGQNRDLLERLVTELKLGDRVSFAGHIAVEEIWPENHVLIMPSRNECLPLTITEAMFAGRTAVATNVGGISEIIKDGVTGFLAAAAAVECFAEALERMWLQRDNLQNMGQAAARSIRQFLPGDPVKVFAGKILNLATEGDRP